MRKKSKQLNIIITMLGCIILMLAIGSNSTIGKYAGGESNTHLPSSNEFYFDSTMMSTTDESTVVHYLYNTNYVEIGINNFESRFAVSPKDIIYGVSATTNDLQGSVDIKINNSATSSGYLTGGSRNTDTVRVESNSTEENVEVTVTVSSTIPYKKNLKAIFIFVNKKMDNSYSIIDAVGSYFATLKITANIEIPAQTITIDWSATNLQIDSTCSAVLNGLVVQPSIGNKLAIIQVAIPANGSLEIRFLKGDAGINSNFSVTTTVITGSTIVIS